MKLMAAAGSASAKGSGKDIAEVNAFMKQFEQMREMMKTMNKMPMGRMMPRRWERSKTYVPKVPKRGWLGTKLVS